jgi:hypothetical protein
VCGGPEVTVRYRVIGTDESEGWRKRVTVMPSALLCARCGEARELDDSTIIEVIRMRT